MGEQGGVFFWPFSFFFLLIYLVLIGVGIYCIVLLIKLAHRGITALDIYIQKNRDRPD
ncbi:hypothetical protein [Cohnella laeviribosi]|jgi:hypothetical protein|uniref:hypothetical protein n=1 Tax=Cohnella laeviribosi TaxID=380174 RepID=UPI00037FAD9F|nr:hypothetical protein [Cohnella laeviribosi]